MEAHAAPVAAHPSVHKGVRVWMKSLAPLAQGGVRSQACRVYSFFSHRSCHTVKLRPRVSVVMRLSAVVMIVPVL